MKDPGLNILVHRLIDSFSLHWRIYSHCETFGSFQESQEAIAWSSAEGTADRKSLRTFETLARSLTIRGYNNLINIKLFVGRSSNRFEKLIIFVTYNTSQKCKQKYHRYIYIYIKTYKKYYYSCINILLVQYIKHWSSDKFF